MKHASTHYDVVILGGGAAGMMCAFVAGQRGLKVLLLEHGEKLGAKILISGGGRCNFTNLDIRPDRYLSKNPHFAKSALSGYTQHHFLDLIKKHNIAFHEKTLGQLFCDGSARQIVAMLEREMAGGGVDVRVKCTIESVAHNDVFKVQTSLGIFEAPQVVVATGAPAIPQMGATGFAYDLARQFCLKIIEPRPALVPLTAYPEDKAWMSKLAGVSLACEATFEKAKFAEKMLFTHKGLSGPAVLQISSYWRAGENVHFNLLPQTNAFDVLIEARKAKPKAELKTILKEMFPERLAETFGAKWSSFARMADANNATLQTIANHIHNWSFLPCGTEGFAKAEVVAGGVDTAELSSKTMESKTVTGLYFIGECVDVTGWLGGYNFQWAWSSGVAAGRSLNK